MYKALTWILVVILLAGLFCNAGLAAAQATHFLQEYQLNETFPVLNGAFTIRMPENTIDAPVNYNGIMGTMSDPAMLTRLIFDGANQRMVVFFQHFYLTGNDLLATAQTYIARQGYPDWALSEIRTLDGGIEYVLFSPPAIPAPSPATLLKALLLRHPDQTLTAMMFMFDEGAMEKPELCEQAAEAILSTLAMSTEQPPLTARDYPLSSTLLPLSEGYGVEHRTGADFDIWYLYKVVEYGEAAPALLVYHGGHPNPTAFSAGMISTADTLLGQAIEWQGMGHPTDTPNSNLLFSTTFEDPHNEHMFWQIQAYPLTSTDWQEMQNSLHGWREKDS